MESTADLSEDWLVKEMKEREDGRYAGRKKSEYIAQVKETLGTNMGSLRWNNSLLLYLDAPLTV